MIEGGRRSRSPLNISWYETHVNGTVRRMGDIPWQDSATCRKMDTVWFFDPDNEAAVAAICLQCPVRQTCFDYAIENDISFGVWGGYRFDMKAQPLRLATGNTERLVLRRLID